MPQGHGRPEVAPAPMPTARVAVPKHCHPGRRSGYGPVPAAAEPTDHHRRKKFTATFELPWLIEVKAEPFTWAVLL